VSTWRAPSDAAGRRATRSHESRIHARGALGRRDPHSGQKLRFAPNIYIVQTQPGFEGVAAEEIAARYGGSASGSSRAAIRDLVRDLGRRVVPERAGIAIFSAVQSEPLIRVRTAEDVFALVAYRTGLGDSPKSLEKVREVAREAPYVDAAIAARVRLVPGSRAGRRLGFRVVTRLAGEHQFRRIDFQRAVERGIAGRRDHSWRLVKEGADVEFWATLLDEEIFLAIRLSDDRMRHREYKVAHRPGSLRPSVAAALDWLSRPGAGDVVVDPMCGAGTILIERAHLGRYAMLTGYDRDSDAIAAARLNIGPRYRPLGLGVADAARLPMRNGAASHLITNLPWGSRFGSHQDNRQLYPLLIEEFARVVRPGGRLVMLTAERALMRGVLERSALRVESVMRVVILGAPAAVYICRN
jgi:tRNA (guanine6-N2)-methyltransferase